MQGESARTGGTVRLSFQSQQSRRNRLQRKELLPRPRSDRDAVGDRVPQQVIQRAGLRVPREPRMLEVALDQAATLQRASNASSDLLYQLLQVNRTTYRIKTETGKVITVFAQNDGRTSEWSID
jgi:hypothetical protein